MSLSSAMNVGVSGLGINAEAITVVGNNIANVNTAGFKEGRTIFSDMLSANIGTGQIGRGGQIQTVQNLFSQGSFENTSGDNDLAIQGESFFVLKDGAGTQSFTRAGAFDFNKSQVLVNPNGLEVVGYGITQATGLSSGVLGSIDKTAFATLAPKTTTSGSFVLNLDSTVNAPNSSVTSSVRVDGDFGRVGMTKNVALTGAGAAGGSVNIVTSSGITYTGVIGTMTVPAAAAQPLTITVNGQTTTIGTYTTVAGNITVLTYNNPVSVSVGTGVTQPITFSDDGTLTGNAPKVTAGTSTGNTIPAATSFTFYDEFGNTQSATVTWGGSTPNYTYSIAIPNATEGTPGSTGFEIAGTLDFPNLTASTVNTTITLNNGAKPMPVTFDLSNMTNTAASTAPTTTVDGAAITTGNVVLTGGTTGGTNIASIALTGGGAGGSTVVTDASGATVTVNTALTNTNAITLTGGGGGIATTAFDKAGTAFAVSVKPANTGTVALAGGGAGLSTTVFGSTGTPNTLTFSFVPGVSPNGVINMAVGAGAPVGVGTYTDDGVARTTFATITWGAPVIVDGTTITLSDAFTMGVTTLAAATTATSTGEIRNFVAGGPVAGIQNGLYTANATTITAANVATTANILIGAGATQATATLSDAGMNGLLTAASTVTSAGSLGYSTAGAAVPFTAFGTYTADATTITASTVAAGTTITAGESRPLITASLTGGTLATATTLTDALGSSGTFVDTTGASHAVTISFPTTTTWRADIVGATPQISTVTGNFTSLANGKSTWDQSSATVTIDGVTQPVSFDLSYVTTGTIATDVRANGWDKTNPAVTANFSNSTQLYDSQGNAHTATIYYSKTGANAWDYHLVVPDATKINGMAGNNILNGTLVFNTSGVLISQTPSNVNGFTVQFPGAVATQTVTLDFNTNASTQLASSSVLSFQSQNGYGAGNLTSTKIDDLGYVNASYTNNQSQRIALLALARFASVTGLEKAGNSLFNSTTKSGTAIIGTSELQGSKIFTKSLEQSTVDMATQLVNMIKLQRAYSGNSKTITSSDEMMQETLSLKR